METKEKLLETKPFEQWYPDELGDNFGLRNIIEMSGLESWVNCEHPIPKPIEPVLKELRDTLNLNRSFWNEAELLSEFINPFLFLIKFSHPKFKAFSQRVLTATIDHYTLTGKVDWMLASGVRIPKAPYFFIHEYKRLQMNEADPIGQLLAEMLAAQVINNDGKPIYGCFIMGHIWTFVLLDGKDYATSEGFDLTTEHDMARVWSILHETKKRVAERVEAETAKSA